MDKKRVLIVGGYGMVGSQMARALAKDSAIMPVVAGRDAKKAAELAASLDCESRVVDIDDRESIARGLEEADVVVNSFSGPFTGVPLTLPEIAIEKGVHYLDVSGSYDYSDRLLSLDARAREKDVALITALGAQPCLAGMLFLTNRSYFEKLSSGELFFVMGPGMANGMSPPAIRELDHMMKVKPLVWADDAWTAPKKSSTRKRIGKPIDKTVLFSAALTRDLLCIPAMTGIRHLALWSGAASMREGLVFMLGLGLGWGHTTKGATRLKSWLGAVGSKQHPEVVLQVQAVGERAGRAECRTLLLHADELFATAIVPAIAARLLVAGTITARGALLPAQAMSAKDLMQGLEAEGIPIDERVEPAEGNRPTT